MDQLAVASHSSFFTFRKARWFWINLAVLVASTVFYFVCSPRGARNGGTFVGYTLGTISAVAIVYLMWFGIRKRSYSSTVGTVEGWLAAHVWLGINLTFLVALHCGFQIGFNVHTLAYVLMLGTIASGIWGALNYVKLPPLLQSHRGKANLPQLCAEIGVVSRQIESLAERKSDRFLELVHAVDFEFKPTIFRDPRRAHGTLLDAEKITPLIVAIGEGEREAANTLLAAARRKLELATRAFAESRRFTALRLWLYLHVPLSFALLVALIIHIFSVFYYR